MKKKTQITKRITTTESIDIVKEVSVPKTENSPLVASSPLRFVNTPPHDIQLAGDITNADVEYSVSE